MSSHLTSTFLTSTFLTSTFLPLTFLLLLRLTTAQDSGDGDGNDVFGLSQITPAASMPSTLDSFSSPGSSSSSSTDDSHQYYYILLAVVLLGLIGCFVLFITKRRKTRAQAARARMVADMEASRGQRVLVNERYWVGSVAGGGGIGGSGGSGGRQWGRGIPMVNRSGQVNRRSERMEGLDERGEAPPPYTKSAEGVDKEEGEGDEADKVPKYEEAVLERSSSSNEGEEVARPGPVHQAGDRM